MIKRTTIIEIITVLNIILFLYTGIAKIMDYSVFKEQLAVSSILGFAAKPVAILLPVVEFLIVVLLLVPRWRLKGLYSSLGLMTAFTVYIIAMFAFSPALPCSCGGIIELLSWQEHLVFNCVFIFLNICAIRIQLREKKELVKEWNDESNYSVSHS